MPEQDIASYNKEQAAGDDLHNVVTIIMHEHGIDLPAALVRAGELHAERARHALDELWPAVRALRFGPALDAALETYVAGLMNWPRGNDSWTFESARYFGADGRRVQRERTVELYPKREARALEK